MVSFYFVIDICNFVFATNNVFFMHVCCAISIIIIIIIISNINNGLLGSRVVSVLDSGAEGPRFKRQPRRCRVTVLGKLFTTSHPSCLCSPSSEIGSSPLKGCEGNCRPGGK